MLAGFLRCASVAGVCRFAGRTREFHRGGEFTAEQ